MAGNRLGPRIKLVYTSDEGTTYSILTDANFQIAGLGAATAAPVEFDPENPPANYGGRFPRGAKPRVVFAQATDGVRRELVACSPTADLYKTNTPQSVTIDSEAFITTGRRGEQVTF